MQKKIIIIGCTAGGIASAVRLRRIDENAEITLLEKGKYIPSDRDMLPYYLGKTSKENMYDARIPEILKNRFNIDVKTCRNVIKIIPENMEIEVDSIKENRKYVEKYDKLILAEASDSLNIKTEIKQSNRIFTLRDTNDVNNIKGQIELNNFQNAVILGAGFTGLKAAETLNKEGIKVEIIELADQVLRAIDFELAVELHDYIRTKGIELHLGDTVKKVEQIEGGLEIKLESGKIMKTQLLIFATGAQPNTKLALEAGLKTGFRKGIVVDKYMRTSNKDIYAIGENVEIVDVILKKQILVPFDMIAVRQGRLVANDIAGVKEHYEGTQQTSILKFFGITVAITGSNEKNLKSHNINYEKSFTYYGIDITHHNDENKGTIKLTFDKGSGKLYGAQVIGHGGVEAKIDVMATAVKVSMTVFELEKLELACEKKSLSNRHPVNVAGHVASNVVSGNVEIFHWDQVEKINMRKSVLIDLRKTDEYKEGTIDGASSIEIDQLRGIMAKIPKGKDVYLFCNTGRLGHVAYRLLIQKGFKSVKNLSGGYKLYFCVSKKPQEQLESKSHKYEEQAKYDLDEQEEVEINGNNFAENSKDEKEIYVDVCNLRYPEPLMKIYEKISKIEIGEILVIRSNNHSFVDDITQWCEATENKIVAVLDEKSSFVVKVRKCQVSDFNMEKNKTMVVFSHELDKAVTAFIIANGSRAMGEEVTMLFTFWGLNILRKNGTKLVKNSLREKVLKTVMPRNSMKLPISNMNTGGIGAKIMRKIMREKNILSLEELMQMAIKSGVRIVACRTSMDILGIKKEELIQGINYGGADLFLKTSKQPNMSLFI